MNSICLNHHLTYDYDSLMKIMMTTKAIKFRDKLEFISSFMERYSLSFLDVLYLMPTKSLAAISLNYFLEPNVFSCFIENNIRCTNNEVLVQDNQRVFGKNFTCLGTRRARYQPIISVLAHNFFVEEILPLGLHHLLLSENLELIQIVDYIDYVVFYKEFSYLHFDSQIVEAINSQPLTLSRKHESQVLRSLTQVWKEDPIEQMNFEGVTDNNPYEREAIKSLVQTPYLYVFWSKLTSKHPEKLKTLEEKLGQANMPQNDFDELVSKSASEVLNNYHKILDSSHFEVFMSILLRKTKRPLFQFIINKKKGLDMLDDFERKFDRRQLGPYISEVINSEKESHLEIAKMIWYFIDHIKNSENSVFLLKNAISVLRFFHFLCVKNQNFAKKDNIPSIPMNSDMKLLARISIWTTTKLLLYANQSELSLFIINYMKRNSDVLFSSLLVEDVSKYLLIFLCFQYIFHRENDHSDRSDLDFIKISKQTINNLIKTLFRVVGMSRFLEQHFYLNMQYEDPDLDQMIRNFYQGVENGQKTLIMITREILENKNFQEKMILILAFLKNFLTEYTPKPSKDGKHPWNPIEDKNNEIVKKLYSSLMMIPGIDDCLKIPRRNSNSNYNLIAVVKNQLLIECFGKLGAYDQNAFLSYQNKCQDIIMRSSTPIDLASYAMNFLEKNMFYMETPLSSLFSSYNKLTRVLANPHSYKSTQAIEERIEVYDDINSGEEEFNILKWIIRLALNLSNEFQNVFDAILELQLENLEFGNRLIPFVLYNYMSSINSNEIMVLAKKFDYIFKKGYIVQRKVCMFAFSILEGWSLEKENKPGQTHASFIKNFHHFREMISKECLIDCFEKSGEFKKAIYYLEILISNKLQANQKGDNIALYLLRLFELYKITNEDFQNIRIEKILGELKYDSKNIKLSVSKEDNSPAIKEILTDTLSMAWFYKEQEIFNKVQCIVPDFTLKYNSFFDYLRILISSTLVIVNVTKDCSEQSSRLILQQSMYIKSLKKGLATQIANSYGRYDESFSFFVKIQVLSDLETLIKLLLQLNSNALGKQTNYKEFASESIGITELKSTSFSFNQLSEKYILKPKELVNPHHLSSFFSQIIGVIKLIWNKLKVLSLNYDEKFLYYNFYKYLVFLMFKKEGSFEAIYARLLFKLMKFSYQSRNLNHASVYYKTLKKHSGSLELMIKYDLLCSKLLFKREKYAKSIQRLRIVNKEKAKVQTLSKHSQSKLKDLEIEANLKLFSYMIKSGLYCVQNVKIEFEHFIIKSPFKSEKMFFKYAKMLDRAFSKPPLEMLQRIIDSYCESIQIANEYFYQSFPRVFRLWLDNYIPLSQKENNLRKDKEILISILQKMSALLSYLPEEKLVYVTNLLLSRVEHDDDEVVCILCQCLARIVDKYPEQSVWWLLSLKYFDFCNPGGTLKKQKRYELIIDLLRRANKSATITIIKEAEPFYYYLLELSKLKDTKFIKHCQPKHIIIPCRDYLFPKIQAENLKSPNFLEPFPEKPVYVIGIDPKVVKLESKEAPTKITFKCSDGKIKHYLLKFEKSGDVRKEARTMDLFNFLNDLFKKDEGTRQRNFEVRTYYIVPMCSNVGLIEWCDNTTAIKQIIEDLWRKKNMKIELEDVLTLHEEKSIPFDGKTLHPEIWEDLKATAPVFKEYFLNKYTDVNLWYENTLNYIKSTALWSAIGYLIGIGDRHSENMLLEISSAKVIHIDFDCIFDKGKALPVPEVVPFRLTKNIESPFGVFQSYGLFRFYLILALQFFRKNIENIIGALDCFLIDPLMENSVFDTNTNIVKIREKMDMRKYMAIEELADSLIKTAKSEESLRLMYFGWIPYL